MLKEKITKLCSEIALKENCRCDAYFSNIHYTGIKVTIEYRHDLYKFKTYKEAIKFLES